MAASPITEKAMKQLFTEARTYNGWQKKAVGNDVLKKIYHLMKFGPTSANCTPLRIVFVKTKEGKARLKPFLAEGNIEKTMAAPVTAILAYDTLFYEHLPMLYPPADAKSWFVGNDALIAETAMRNSSLQGAYFILAARALGLDCGPMSGFDPAKINAEFFKDGRFKVNFICNIGHGDKTKVYPRSPRFKFGDVCQIA